MSVVSTWDYIKAGFWQRISLPLAGRVPVNAVAVAGFGIAGLDHPVFWAAGAAWEVLWMAATSGRAGYRRGVDRAARRAAWRTVEERRLQLYNQLPAEAKSRHHALRESCRVLLRPGSGGEPDAAAELLCWLHLKLLLARVRAGSAGKERAGVRGEASGGGGDADAPRLHAGAAVELTDPAAARLAEEAVSILDPRHGVIRDHTLEPVPRIDAALRKIEVELAQAVAAATRRQAAAGGGALKSGAGAGAGAGAGGDDRSQAPPAVGGMDSGAGADPDWSRRVREAADMEARLRADLGYGEAVETRQAGELLEELGRSVGMAEQS